MKGGDEDDRQVRLGGLELLNDLEPADARHLQIGHDDVVSAAQRRRESGGGICLHFHFKSLRAQEVLQGGGDGVVVFDDEYSCHDFFPVTGLTPAG